MGDYDERLRELMRQEEEIQFTSFTNETSAGGWYGVAGGGEEARKGRSRER